MRYRDEVRKTWWS